MLQIIRFLFIPILFLSCKTQEIPAEQPPATVKNYSNPVVNYSLPDPTVIRANDGYSISMLPRISEIPPSIDPLIW